MTPQEAENQIYRLSEQMSEELAEARQAYDQAIFEIWTRYEPILTHLTKRIPSTEFAPSEFSIRLKQQNRSAA